MTHRSTLTCMTERTSDDAAERLLTKRQVADELQVSTRTVDRYIHDGVIRAVKLGAGKRSAVRIERSELDRRTTGEPAA